MTYLLTYLPSQTSPLWGGVSSLSSSPTKYFASAHASPRIRVRSRARSVKCARWTYVPCHRSVHLCDCYVVAGAMLDSVAGWLSPCCRATCVGLSTTSHAAEQAPVRLASTRRLYN